jgi:hypothetical protein
LQELVRTAAGLPGRKLEVALWQRLGPWETTPSPRSETVESGDDPDTARPEVARLRAVVAACLERLAARIDETLVPALRRARKSWDRVDDLVIVDPPLAAALAAARRQLESAAAAGEGAQGGPVAAVALEGLLALETAAGLAALAERRLSTLIRLRVRSPGCDGELLPGGRPFLDLGAALAEVAHSWA